MHLIRAISVWPLPSPRAGRSGGGGGFLAFAVDVHGLARCFCIQKRICNPETYLPTFPRTHSQLYLLYLCPKLVHTPDTPCTKNLVTAVARSDLDGRPAT
jgi:hypothetical protein